MAHRDTAALLRKHGYTEIKKVGEGSFGKAILVKSNANVQLICKMVDVSRASRKEAEDAAKEAKVLSGLNHPYIVNYRESFTETGWFCILMDYCESGDLTKQITEAKRARKSIPEEQVLKWFTQTILALKYIHEKHILHRDLKPQNLFLSKSGNLKMGDFGISKVLDCTLAVARTQIGTPYYLSPELCQEKPYTWPSDIWSMGCILYEMCALKVPFDAESIPKLVQKICRGDVPTVPATYSTFIRDLAKEMLSKDQNRRPDCENILKRGAIQAIVQSMMEDAKEKAEESNLQAPELRRNGSDLNAPQSARSNNGYNGNGAIAYSKDDTIEFWSQTHQCWLPAVVINTDSEGRIQIDLKPNTWVSKEQQAQFVRPRAAGNQRQRPQPRVPASPGRGRSPSPASYTPKFQRSPSQGSVGGRPSSRGASPMVKNSPRGAAGSFWKGDLCEYWSTSHNDWLPAVVVNRLDNGSICIDLKPNTWISVHEQLTKIRARQGGGRFPGAPHRPSSGGIASSPQLHKPPLHKSPSWGCSPSYRAPSPSYRVPSPSRAMTPLGARGSSPSGRAGTPSQRDMTPRRAASREPSPHGMLPRPRVPQSPLRAGGHLISGT
jgi:NIMA (never in mitosis gene a)-related kinase